MRCLLCDSSLYKGANIYEALFVDDVICFACRSLFKLNKKRHKVGGLKLDATYIYDENFSRVLVAYKDLLDEALYKVFLYRIKKYFRYKYHGYTLVLIPSSKSKISERGFNHLYKIFKETNLEILDCLYKVKDIKQVTSKNREEMIDNIGLHPCKLPQKILLVDDVVTSGSSMLGALKVLRGRVKTIKLYTIAVNIK